MLRLILVCCSLWLAFTSTAGAQAEAPRESGQARSEAIARLIRDHARGDAQAPGVAEAVAQIPGLGADDHADLLVAVASEAVRNDRLADAQQFLEAALKLREAAGPPDLAWAECAEQLASVLARRSDFAHAAALQRRVVGWRESTEGEDAPALLPHLARLEDMLGGAGDPDAKFVRSRITELEARAEAQATRIVALGPPPAPPPGKQLTDVVRVFFATDRQPVPPGHVAAQPTDYFGATRGPLQFGFADVRVPQRPVPRGLAAVSIWGVEIAPSRLKTASVGPPRRFASAAAFHAAISGARPGDSEILIYVHGYNTTFLRSVKTAGALAMDLDVRGPVIAFAWPSRGSLIGYFDDARMADGAQPGLDADLARLIADVRRNNPQARLYLVAHSMGNRIALRALARLAREQQGPVLTQTVLASPDVGVARFSADIAKAAQASKATTLYASRRDLALRVSTLVNDEARAGAPGTLPAVHAIDKVDTSDAEQVLASAAESDLLGHDDYLRFALTDLRGILWRDHRPAERCFLSPLPDGYFAFASRTCSISEYAAAVVYLRRLGVQAEGEARLQANDLAVNDEVKRQWLRIADLIARFERAP